MTDLPTFSRIWLPKIESYLRGLLAGETPAVSGLYRMLRYHMGWENQAGEPEHAPQGKRVRPLLVLMSCLAAGGDPIQALPAAAAVELVHNFSLIHDDIEDGSLTRRHRPTLWTWVGQAQAINAGDALFTLARLALLQLDELEIPLPRLVAALRLFDHTCLHLTEGQYLDISFETRDRVTADEYMTMIAGKTAALLAASAQLGALVATDNAAITTACRRFGYELGLSFQIQDDILGIWGDEALTGKSASSDLLTRKKTLPVLYALAQDDDAAAALTVYYNPGRELTPADLPAMLSLLDRLQARAYAETVAQAHAEAALAALDEAPLTAEGRGLLRALAVQLLGRKR
jgi:geranylgeranyl diphosphate synthase type I